MTRVRALASVVVVAVVLPKIAQAQVVSRARPDALWPVVRPADQPERVSGAQVAAATGAWVGIVPIEPDSIGAPAYPPGVTIVGDTVIVDSIPQEVWFELQLGGWGTEIDLHVWQMQMDVSSFSNGIGEDLVVPEHVSCDTVNPICESIFGRGSQCQQLAWQGCEYLFQDTDRNDAPFFAVPALHQADQFGIRVGALAIDQSDNEVDDGSTYYGANLALEIPTGAIGIYDVGIAANGQTFLGYHGGNFDITEYRTARVIVNGVGGCCLSSTCSLMNVLDCVDAGGIVGASCPGDCDGDGIDNGCQSQADCNHNGQLDLCELAAGTVDDCNSNGVPDECEIADGSEDCNSNGVIDSCETADGSVPDCNSNGVPDECDLSHQDCNHNGLVDECEIADGLAEDCDGNHHPDECDLVLFDCNFNDLVDQCEIDDGSAPDCNNNHRPDECDLQSHDCDGNGVVDECETADGSAPDCNLNGRPDVCDLVDGDCDGNGLVDSCETADGSAPDCNLNGRPDVCDLVESDCDGNGVVDECELAEHDCNQNGILDACETGAADCNQNGVPDDCEVLVGDCNHNGIVDACDVFAGAEDCDGNLVPDECQLALGDCNGNGVLDSCEGITASDCDQDGICDALELTGAGTDCNDNGVLDECDIIDGTSLDDDGNCIPDECDQNPAPLAEAVSLHKSRFLVFTPVKASCNTAIRVRFVSLTPPGVGSRFSASEGDWRWVGPPGAYWEDGNHETTMYASGLQCEPYYRAWELDGQLNVYGAGIMPESTYEVQHFDGNCGDVNDPACYSQSLMVSTGVWGDCVAPFADDPNPTAQPDFTDVSALVDRFLANGGPPRLSGELDPNVLNLAVDTDFNDISSCVSSFLGEPYPYQGPGVCP